MRALPDGHVSALAPLYESEPWGDSPTWYLNGVVQLDTERSGPALLASLLDIETALGRVRVAGERWAARTIDLDVLLFGDAILDTPALTVPHPEMHRRRFVLQPLADLAPDLIHPIRGRTIADLLAALVDPHRIRPWPPQPD